MHAIIAQQLFLLHLEIVNVFRTGACLQLNILSVWSQLQKKLRVEMLGTRLFYRCQWHLVLYHTKSIVLRLLLKVGSVNSNFRSVVGLRVKSLQRIRSLDVSFFYCHYKMFGVSSDAPSISNTRYWVCVFHQKFALASDNEWTLKIPTLKKIIGLVT